MEVLRRLRVVIAARHFDAKALRHTAGGLGDLVVLDRQAVHSPMYHDDAAGALAVGVEHRAANRVAADNAAGHRRKVEIVIEYGCGTIVIEDIVLDQQVSRATKPRRSQVVVQVRVAQRDAVVLPTVHRMRVVCGVDAVVEATDLEVLHQHVVYRVVHEDAGEPTTHAAEHATATQVQVSDDVATIGGLDTRVADIEQIAVVSRFRQDGLGRGAPRRAVAIPGHRVRRRGCWYVDAHTCVGPSTALGKQDRVTPLKPGQL